MNKVPCPMCNLPDVFDETSVGLSCVCGCILVRWMVPVWGGYANEYLPPDDSTVVVLGEALGEAFADGLAAQIENMGNHG